MGKVAFVHCSCVQQNGVEGPLFCTHLFEKAGLGRILGDVYRETCLRGRFYVHTSSVQRPKQGAQIRNNLVKSHQVTLL